MWSPKDSLCFQINMQSEVMPAYAHLQKQVKERISANPSLFVFQFSTTARCARRFKHGTCIRMAASTSCTNGRCREHRTDALRCMVKCGNICCSIWLHLAPQRSPRVHGWHKRHWRYGPIVAFESPSTAPFDFLITIYLIYRYPVETAGFAM